MRIAIVFSSRTGNTAQIAQAIRQACTGHEVTAFGPPPQNVDRAQVVFAGSWTDKGDMTQEMKEFLHTLHGKRVAVFGTAGFGISELYFAALAERFKGHVPEGNQVVSSFFCTGRMPDEVRERYERQLQERPGDEKLNGMLKVFELALTHPDRNDLDQAKKFAREVLNA